MLSVKCSIENAIRRFSVTCHVSLVIAMLMVLASPCKIIAFNAASVNLIVNGDFSANAAQYVNSPGYSKSPSPAAPAYWNNGKNLNAGINGPDTTTGNPFSPGMQPACGILRFCKAPGLPYPKPSRQLPGEPIPFRTPQRRAAAMFQPIMTH